MNELRQYIDSHLQATGIVLVDLKISKKERLPCFKLVVYRNEGTGIDDCTRVHRQIQAGLEERLGNDDFYIEVMSPGIDWSFISENDYRIFKGRGVTIKLNDGTEAGGLLAGVDGQLVTLLTPQGDREIAFEHIHGCKLDFSREGR